MFGHSRSGTAAYLAATNPVLGFNEFAIETDTGKVKRGLGFTTAYNDLAYWDPAGLQAVDTALDARLDTAETDIDALQAEDTALDARLDIVEAPLVGAKLTSGCANQSRSNAATACITASQLLVVCPFSVPAAFTAANVRFFSSATAAGATPSLVKFALFSIAGNGDYTRIGITASDTAIFAAANTAYSRALLATVALVPGQAYATGMLLVTAAATPTLVGPTAAVGSVAPFTTLPQLCGQVAAQADIGTSYTAAQVGTSVVRYYAEITP